MLYNFEKLKQKIHLLVVLAVWIKVVNISRFNKNRSGAWEFEARYKTEQFLTSTKTFKISKGEESAVRVEAIVLVNECCESGEKTQWCEATTQIEEDSQKIYQLISKQ